jgi:hypothetical protein
MERIAFMIASEKGLKGSGPTQTFTGRCKRLYGLSDRPPVLITATK